MKKHSNKKLVMTRDDIGSVIMIILILMLKSEILAISPENIEVLHIEIVISMLNQIIKFLLYFRT